MSAQIPLTKNVFVSVNIPVKGGLLCYAYCQRSSCVAGTGYECKLFNLLLEKKEKKCSAMQHLRERLDGFVRIRPPAHYANAATTRLRSLQCV